MFSEHIKELRIQNQMPQRQLAAALDIDTATYCKIEKEREEPKENKFLFYPNCLMLTRSSC